MRSGFLRGALLFAQVVLGAILLWWAISWVDLNAHQLMQVFKSASFSSLSLAVLFFAVSMLLRALQLQRFLPHSISITYLTGVAFSQNALLTFLPWRVGEASLPLLLRKDFEIPLLRSITALLVIRFCDFLVVVTVALIGSLKLGLNIYWLVIGLILVAIVALLSLLLMKGRNQRLRALRERIDVLRHAPELAVCLILAAGIFFFTTLQALVVLRAMGLFVTVPDVLRLNALGLLAALLPIHPPGGWGTMDSIQVFILQKLAYAPAETVPAILATHCFYTVLIFLGGVGGWILRRLAQSPSVTVS